MVLRLRGGPYPPARPNRALMQDARFRRDLSLEVNEERIQQANASQAALRGEVDALNEMSAADRGAVLAAARGP